mmetsp:Transcript_4562/g.10248  ORF Transcript_4562/g.10248 Transcript_4562/m.10248 type:complete len:99 (+) Transcript_4562:66-362(+)
MHDPSAPGYPTSSEAGGQHDRRLWLSVSFAERRMLSGSRFEAVRPTNVLKRSSKVGCCLLLPSHGSKTLTQRTLSHAQMCKERRQNKQLLGRSASTIF